MVRIKVFEKFAACLPKFWGRPPVDSNLSGTVGRFGGGLTVKVSQSGYLYGEYEYATGDHFQQPWSVSARLRWQW
jgi:outer membrane autotransporter protein